MTAFADPDSSVGPKPPPHVLRGPEHADNYRIKVGRYRDRWYRDPLYDCPIALAAGPDEAYPSVSVVKGAAGKDWTYVALKRVANAPDLADIAGRGFYERYERLKVINSLDLSAAQRRGTNVHTWAECRAYGTLPFLTENDEGGVYFPIVDKLWTELQPELIAAEVVAIHRTMNGAGYGGTSDGIFRIDGKTYMVDWKSRGQDSDHGCYPEEAGQLGAYCGAEYMIVADDDPSNPHGAKRIEVPHLDGALVVSIRPDSYEVYPVDLDRAKDHFAAMHGWWLARREEGKTVGAKWPPRRQVAGEEEPALAPSPHDPDVERRELLYARHDGLTQAQQAEFKRRSVNINGFDLDAVEQLIDDIENPPSLLEMAKRRMSKDAGRATDRRLADEGGEPADDDVKLFELRWDMGMTDAGHRWLTVVINEAMDAGFDFRLSQFRSQRRVDLFCALTEWATVDEFDARDDRPFRAAINQVATFPHIATAPIGALVGALTADQAAGLRYLVTEIAAKRMTFDPWEEV